MRYILSMPPKKPLPILQVRGNHMIIPEETGNLLMVSEFDDEIHRRIKCDKEAYNLLIALKPLLEQGDYTKGEIIQKLKLDGFKEDSIRKLLAYLQEKEIIWEPSWDSFTEDEIKRYKYQLSLFSYFSSENSQENLKKAKVMVIGLGNIGARAIPLLSLLGIGEITGVDSQEVTKEDLFQCEVYTQKDIGALRSEVWVKKCREINSNVKFNADHRILDKEENIYSLIQDNIPDILLLCLDQQNTSLIEQINEACLKAKVPWCSCFTKGTIGVIGPMVIPYQTPCYHCYELRKEACVAHYEEYCSYKKYKKKHQINHTVGTLGVFACVVAGVLVNEAMQFLTHIAVPVTCGKIISIDFMRMHMVAHSILKLPRCPKCGLPSKNEPEEMVWSSE
jgi:adenylyltransferase/sulfurtransferase